MRCMMAFALAVFFDAIAVPATPVTASVPESRRQAELTLPDARLQPLPSPDGTHTLYGVESQDGKTAGSQLWIRDNSTGAGRLLLTIGGSMQAFWSPDGAAFSVNDHRVSDRESAYTYDTETLKRQNVGEDILAADPESRHFTDAHAYFHVERWDGPAHLVVRFHGHTDKAPVQCFDFQYRVSRTGAVEKLSERVHPVDSNLPCD
jgi:hypothetical protein